MREILAAGLGGDRARLGHEEEARCQSILISGRQSEREAFDLIERAADTRGWE